MGYSSFIAFGFAVCSVCIISIISSANGANDKTCKWAPGCTCEHVESVDEEVECVYYSMYINGHDLANCHNQREFPKFSATEAKNDYTEISGTFSRIPANAFSLPQYSTSACVSISTRSEVLIVEPFAFKNAAGMFTFTYIKNLTISSNVLSASNQNSRSRYGTLRGSVHLRNVEHVYLPKLMDNQNLTGENISDAEFHLKVVDSRLANVDGKRFEFGDVDKITLEEIEINNFQEIVDLFRITPTKKVKYVWLTAFWLNPRPLKFRIVFENAILSNSYNKPSVDLGLPVDRVQSISFAENKLDDTNFTDLSIFNKSLKSFTCSKCNLTRIPNDIRLMSKLEDLNLSNNKIATIPENILTSKNLQNLNLDNNQIRSIDGKAFEKLTNLKSIVLSHNPIGMKYFDIINSLGRISSKLTNFACDECQLTDIPSAITSNKILKSLSLDGNRIRKILLNDFRGTNTLTEVRLSNNQIDTIEKGVFENSYIAGLNLENNSFVEMDMANVSFLINEAEHLDRRASISLNKNERLRKVFTSKQPKNLSYCPFLSIDSPNLEEVDKNLLIHCRRDHWAATMTFQGSKKFNCELDLEWIAKDIIANTSDCNGSRMFFYHTKCKDTGKALRDHLWSKYFSKNSKCVKADSL